MSLEEHLREGRLDLALEEQTERVRSKPGDPDERCAMVGLLALAGQLDRAEIHLKAMAQQDPALLPATAVYADLINAEEERRRVFAHGTAPNLPPGSPVELRQRTEVPAAIAQGAWDQAKLQLVDLPGPTPRGELDGQPIGELRDYDDIIGPVVEVFAGGRYLWLPFSQIRSLEFSEPRSLLDLIWAPGNLVDADGDDAAVHVPVLYAGSADREDAMVRIGRKTEWDDIEGFAFRGFGQRMWVADGEREVPFLSVRKLSFPETEADAEAAAGG